MDKNIVERIRVQLERITNRKVEFRTNLGSGLKEESGFVFINPRNPLLPFVNVSNDELNAFKSTDEAVEEIIRLYHNLPEFSASCLNILEDRIWLLSNVQRCLCSTEYGADFLEEVPHLDFHDFSVYYRGVIDLGKGNIVTFVITHDILKVVGLNVEDIEKASIKNMKNDNSISLSIVELLTDPNTNADSLYNVQKRNSVQMYVIDKKNAGGAMLDFIISSLANTLNDDMYVVPTVTKEIVAIPVNGASLTRFKEFIEAAHIDAVSNCEEGTLILKYCRDSKNLSKYRINR